MKTRDLIERLHFLIDELRELDPDLPAGIIFSATHHCCGTSEYCYIDGEDQEIYSLTIAKDERYDKKTKKQTLRKIWLKGD